MSSWLEGVLGSAASVTMVAVVAGFFRALSTLKANTDAIKNLNATFSEWRAENNRALDAQNARLLDLETWRTAVTASLFRLAGEHKPE